ncbi:hypothetical protein HYH03_003788 [Edaphochlamys debaryana]|uniref:Uncharacterized protein n=1 Tax=Edaphochlamys debaryana TaxID=47281 RepID=A0A836C3Q8_9CHLO|nr:hypothetical protein HYH03_003788 [Edaphochlamys debaryana]|eukprot:KAG2498027.1 hypothetical protein HYH03_003788 [Edaphochlamys debaryana]
MASPRRAPLVLACLLGAAALASAFEPPRILVELFVMSRCPDARRCEERMEALVQRIGPLLDMRTVYIADVGSDKRLKQVTCKHGPAECAGDAQQLCAAAYGRTDGAPGEPADPYALGWRFLQCQNDDFASVGDVQLAEKCLEVAGFNSTQAAGAIGCWAGKEGDRLLYASASEASWRRVAKSCTIYVDRLYRCTHDGATWYDCPGGSEVDDFVATVCAAYADAGGDWPQDLCGPAPDPETRAHLRLGGRGEGAEQQAATVEA